MALSNKNLTTKDAPKAEKPAKQQTAARAESARDEAEAPEIASDRLNSLSKSIAIVKALGDPSDPDRTYKAAAEGEKPKPISRSRHVGYRIANVGDKPFTIVEYGLGDDWTRKSESRLNHRAEGKERQLKPGEEVNMTLFELAVLLATPEFNKVVDGGEYHVVAKYIQNAGSGDSTLNSGENMSFQLRPVKSDDRPDFTLADIPCVDVITVDHVRTENGRTRVANRKIVPGFEDKFAPVAAESKRQVGRSRTATAKPTTYAADARQFLKQAAPALASK